MQKMNNNWQYRDWEQHGRIIEQLHRNKITIKEMSVKIGEDIYAVSKCIWGIPGRRIARIENKLAAFLDVPIEKLFSCRVA